MATMTEHNVPNMDCMSRRELRDFAERHQDGARAALLFPHDQGADAINSTRRLAVYARLKAEAQGHRIAGEIAKAISYEDRCDAIYRALPADVRW